MNRALIVLMLGLGWSSSAVASVVTPKALLRAAFNNWRGNTSTTVVVMHVHRPDWQRSLEMRTWTKGDADALVRFVAPAKDAGNATLKVGSHTLVFNPKLNQVITLPASMLSQSWMGSDFSYNDLSKADDILSQYTHRIIKTEKANGHTVYTIDAVPKPGAPVVWGKLVVKVRDDGVMLGETYFDQDMKPVRTMTTQKVGAIDGRPYPVIMVMRPADASGNWTRLVTKSGRFNLGLPAYVFTRSNLRNPRN